jgi:anti-repressor protein
MNGLQVFQNSEFGELDILIEGDKAYFPATKCAEKLGYSNPIDAILRHCKGVVKRDSLTKGGSQQVNFITEGDLYRLIANSKLQGASKFESWVFDDVLPSIRKHGAYMTPETLEKTLLNPDYLIQLATRLKEEMALRVQAETKLIAAEPKVIFYETVTGSKTTFDMATIAKIINYRGVGRNTLFSILRNKCILQRDNTPYQRYVDQGWFRLIESKYQKPDGTVVVTTKTVVYQKGIQGVIQILDGLGFKKVS